MCSLKDDGQKCATAVAPVPMAGLTAGLQDDSFEEYLLWHAMEWRDAGCDFRSHRLNGTFSSS